VEYNEAALQKVREDRLLIDEVDTWLYEEITPYLGSRMLEVGCGMGNFVEYLKDREFYMGTDVSVYSVTHIQEIYRGFPNVQARVVDVVDDAFRKLVEFKFDTVFSLNVFEHVADDLRALKNAFHVLQPGGKIIIVVPAHAWLYGAIDCSIGHYRRYGKNDIEQLFAKTGFALLKLKYINALGALGWLVSGRVLHNTTPPSGQLRLFNRLVPLLKAVERKIPVPFGISLLTVAKKPDGG